MGKDRSHLAFFSRQGEQAFRCVAFGQAHLAPALSAPGARADLAYRLKFDSYSEPGSVELEIEAVRPR